MKKKVWVFTALFLVVLSVVCAIVVLKFFPDGKQEPSLEEKRDAENRLVLDSHMSKSYTDDLPGLMQKKFNRVLTTLNRTNFFVSDGHLIGYE